MKFNRYLCALIALSGVMLSACQKQLEPVSNEDFIIEKSSQTPNRFDSKESLKATIKRSMAELRNYNGTYHYYDDENRELEDLVPNDAFRKLLTPKGEIIVNDTLYRITPYGTFFTPVEKTPELNRIIENRSYKEMKKIGEGLYSMNGVSLIKTFGESNSYEISKDESEKNVATINSNLRSLTGDEPNISQFPVKNVDRITILGKFFQSLVGTKKDGEELLKNNGRRRISGSLYSYNYGVYREMGLMAQIDKKMWHGGWGRVDDWSDGTTIGYYGLIVKEKIENLESVWSKYTFGTWRDLEIIGDHRGICLDIVKENFLLNNEDKFAFYAFRKTSEPSYEEIQTIASILNKQSENMSFATLEEVNETPFVGFIIDVPEAKSRFIYMKGTKRWQGGPRQVKVFDSDHLEIDFNELSRGYKKVQDSYQYIVNQVQASNRNKQQYPPHYFPEFNGGRNNMMYPRNYSEYQRALKNANIHAPGITSEESSFVMAGYKLAQGIKGLSIMAQSFKFPKKSLYRISGDTYCHTRYAGEYTGLIMHKQKFD